MNRFMKRKKMRKIEKLRWFRIVVQIGFFLGAPSIYSAAFTAVKNAFTAIGAGKTLEMNGFTIQFLAVIALTIVFGRCFCGWACAFGALNDWVYQISQWIQKKVKKKLPSIPEKTAGRLVGLKYAVLMVLLCLCFFQKGNLITPKSPWTVFSLLRSGRLSISGYEIGIVLFVLCVIGMCFSERFFCRFFCPMGAVFSILPRGFRLKRNAAECPEKCGACRRVCPVELLIEKDALNMGECIQCGRCSVICPRKNIWIFRKPGRKS